MRMKYTVDQIRRWNTGVEIEPNRWVPARPLDGPFIWRVKAAWEVLMSRADALTWEKQ